MLDFIVDTASDSGDDRSTSFDLDEDRADGEGLSLAEAFFGVISTGAGATGEEVRILFDPDIFADVTSIDLTNSISVAGNVTLDGDFDDDGAPDITITGGADVVEIDIHWTKDKHFAVFHDWELDAAPRLRGKLKPLPAQS